MTFQPWIPGLNSGGLSPRVRGNPDQARLNQNMYRSIPACAGEPSYWLKERTRAGVYPRVCGGTNQSYKFEQTSKGLSPRVRGNLTDPADLVKADGSIPACAGEPGGPPFSRFSCTVYPRVCGGTVYRGTVSGTYTGLSPRVRGNHPFALQDEYHIGSIPACAGEPPIHRRRTGRLWVYPRVCGGTGNCLAAAIFP